MTRAISPENFAALQAGRFVARDFVRFVVRDRDTGNPVSDAYWSDVFDITAYVVDFESGLPVQRSFAAGGGLIRISDVALVSNLTVQKFTITLSGVSDHVNTLLRAYDCKQGRVEVHRGLFDKRTRVMVAPAIPRALGTIDEAPIRTPKENQPGDATLTCTGCTQELMRSNPDTSCDASQRLRHSTDNFFQDAAVVGTWQVFWGRAGGPIRTTAPFGPPGAFK